MNGGARASTAEAHRIKVLEAEIALERAKQSLPHLYRYPFYKWSREVFESTNPEILLVAANQLSKSSTAIRKNIEWATNKSLWPKLWPGKTPNLFWYFYPNFNLATSEFETKWQEFLPKDKNDPVYGWEEYYVKGQVDKIVFKSGIILQFKAYSQKLIDIQASSVYFLTCDEELPIHMLPELKARLNATDGYFLQVFTATLGQQYWKDALEPRAGAVENFPNALKMCISLYDSQFYEDGSPSPWTPEKIKRAIANCPTEAEVQRRVYGRFVRSEGLKYESFDAEKNMCDPHPYNGWQIYGGVDPGSGGKSGHPAGMLLVAVNPANTQARVIKGWRGDGIPTTSQDILDRYKIMKLGKTVSPQIYDYAAKDFFMIASRQGENFIPADKSKGSGEALLNMLFKSGMLKIHRGDSELDKLVSELTSLSPNTDKREAKDDLIDPLRYICMAVPWDFSAIEVPEELKTPFVEPAPKKSGEERRAFFFDKGPEVDSIEAEFGEWNDLMEG